MGVRGGSVRTFQRFGKEVGCWLVLLDVVPLHDFPLLVQTEVPAPARLLLPIYHGGVRHVIVLEHRLLEFALWCKVFLGGQKEM